MEERLKGRTSVRSKGKDFDKNQMERLGKDLKGRINERTKGTNRMVPKGKN